MMARRAEAPKVGSPAISRSRFFQPVVEAVNRDQVGARDAVDEATARNQDQGDVRGTVTSEGLYTLQVDLVDGRTVTVLKHEDLRGYIATRTGVDQPQYIFPSYSSNPEIWVRPIAAGSELHDATHYEVAPPRLWFELEAT